MAVFKRTADGSLELVSVTKCCKNCGGKTAQKAPVPATTAPAPSNVPVAPANHSEINEEKDDASND